jgi:hypothetical protein
LSLLFEANHHMGLLMPNCTEEIGVEKIEFSRVVRRAVEGRFDGGSMHQESLVQPRVMSISVHPYLSGVPHRIGYVEQLYDYVLGHEGVVIWTGEEILDWFLAQQPKNVA